MSDHLALRLRDLPDSATMSITARAAAMRAAGEPVIGFGAGEPDFPTPAHIVAAAQAALADPSVHRYGPPQGKPSLRGAVAEVTHRETGLAVGPDNVAVTVGAKGAVYGAMAAILEPGDEVMLPAPYWVTYPAATSLFGASVRTVAATAVDGFKVTPDALEAARSPRTRMLIFCSPNNPTGAVYRPDEVAAIGEWAARHGIWVLSDDIYRSLVYGSAEFASMPVLVPEVAERCIVVDGPAKAFAMTGWRVGWLIGPPAIASAVGRLQAHSTSNVATVLQVAAEAAITGSRDSVVAMREAFDRRRRLMVDLLSGIPGLVCPEPEGAFYAFPSVEGLLGSPLGSRTPGTSAEYAETLLDEAQIAVVPGEAFGAPGYLRLSFALGDDELAEGLGRWRRLAVGG
jgi:aspartate aminotransferase